MKGHDTTARIWELDNIMMFFLFSIQHRYCSRYNGTYSQLALGKLFITVEQYQIWSLDTDIEISTVQHLYFGGAGHQ